MKKKTEAKRQAILNVAAQTFRELGFEKTSMSEICTRVGGSKATIYNYFSSKDELFFEVMFLSLEAEFDVVHRFLQEAPEDIETALRDFGKKLLKFLYSEELQAQRHLAIEQSGKTELGKIAYERGALRSQNIVADYLKEAAAQEKLRPEDPFIMTKHLYALLEAEFMDRVMFRVHHLITQDEIDVAVERSIRVFMAAYGTSSKA
ncbi:MAG: TetR/AcrR family transcriptional regulator [Sulfuricurvum sp.]